MTIGNIQIEGIIYPIKLLYKKTQSRGVAMSGAVKIASSNFEDIFISIKIMKKNLIVAQNLRSYIRNMINYSSNTLEILPDADIDLGNGVGNSITVRYWSDNFDYVYEKGNLFDFEFIFRKEII
jgi:hypothetical protein